MPLFWFTSRSSRATVAVGLAVDGGGHRPLLAGEAGLGGDGEGEQEQEKEMAHVRPTPRSCSRVKPGTTNLSASWALERERRRT